MGDRGVVLLVEDDDDLRRILARQLRARGYTVSEAGSAEEAEQRLHDEPAPGLVILDINLPCDTGWDLLRSDALAAAASPPVVIESALPVRPGRLVEFGVAGYLPKPFPLDTFMDTVERLLHRNEASGNA